MADDEKKAAEPSDGDERRKKRTRSRSRSRGRNRSQAATPRAQEGRVAKADSPSSRADRGRAKAPRGPSKQAARPQTAAPAERRPPAARTRPPAKAGVRPARSEPKLEEWREPEDRPAARFGLRSGRAEAQSEEQREPAGAVFFRSFENYDQEEAREWLSDPNIKLIQRADPKPGEWAYCPLVEERCPAREVEQVKRALPIPDDVYAVLVDSGLSLRAILTGTPMYERLLEFNFIDEASFDCWIQGEWVREEVFDGKAELLRRAVRLLEEYLQKDIVSNEDIVQAPRPDGALPPARTEW